MYKAGKEETAWYQGKQRSRILADQQLYNNCKSSEQIISARILDFLSKGKLREKCFFSDHSNELCKTEHIKCKHWPGERILS